MNFLNYLLESQNSDTYELNTADELNKWFRAHKLSRKYKAEKSYLGNKFSDVKVIDLTDATKSFYIECKTNTEDNVVNITYELNTDLSLIPVHGREHLPFVGDENELIHKYTTKLMVTPEYRKFKRFMRTKNPLLKLHNGKVVTPFVMWNSDEDVDDDCLKKLVKKYNSQDRNISKNWTPIEGVAVNKKNSVAVALAWKFNVLNNPSLILDISTVRIQQDMAHLVSWHYNMFKSDVKYIYIDHLLFVFDENDNPLNVECATWPQSLDGVLTVRFKKESTGPSKSANYSKASYLLKTRSMITGNALKKYNAPSITNMRLK